MFNKKLKAKIIERDNYKCQYPDCNITQKQHLKKYKQNLHVHHIDYNTSHADPEKLITLCNTHNHISNGNIDYHYALFTFLLNKK